MRWNASAPLARRLFSDLRREGMGRGREALAMGLGACIGCLPVYGFHLVIVLVVGRILRLNRLKMYVAANISNPLFAPALILAEIQTGAWLRRGDTHELSIDAVRGTDPWMFGADLLIGSVAVAIALGVLIAVVTFAASGPSSGLAPHLEQTLAAAADRYVGVSITAWEFARGKLRRDPIYKAVLAEPLPSVGTLVDIGCGQGLALAVIAEARAGVSRGEWPNDAMVRAPPMLIGIETRQRVSRLAQGAVGDVADIRHATAPDGLPEKISAALLLDVLHLLPADSQMQIISAVHARLSPDGVVLVRDVDAAAGSGFRAVRIGNRIKALAVGRWRQTFHFRSEAAWRALFEQAGFRVETRPMGEGTPFANVLFRLTKGTKDHARELMADGFHVLSA